MSKKPILNPRAALTAFPIVVFLILSRGLDNWLDIPSWVAILGGFISSGVVFVVNRKERVLGALAIFGFVIVAVSAVVGIIWDSEKAYLASGPVSDFLFVPAYAGSVLLRKPLIGAIARELFPAWAEHIPANEPVYAQLCWAWAVYDLAHGIARVIMLSELSVTQYILISRVSSWPFTALLIYMTVKGIKGAAARYAPLEPQPAPEGALAEPA